MERGWNINTVALLATPRSHTFASWRFSGIVIAPLLAKLLDFFPPYYPALDTPRSECGQSFWQ